MTPQEAVPVVYALYKAQVQIQRMLRDGEWYDPQGALEAIDVALASVKVEGPMPEIPAL